MSLRGLDNIAMQPAQHVSAACVHEHSSDGKFQHLLGDEDVNINCDV